jgi:hypothetical protein
VNEKDEMVYITSRISKYTYDNLVIVAKREGIDMSDIIEYCLSNIVNEFS